MNRNIALAVVLLIVAGLSYAVGRRHGASATAAGPADRPLSTAESAQMPVFPKPSVAKRFHPRPEGFRPEDLDGSAPFAQNFASAQRGYATARINLEEALNQIESLPVTERLGFTTGVFSFVARNQSPPEALKIYRRVPEGLRANALRALVGEWIYTRSPLAEDQRYMKREATFTISGSRLGLEVELTSMLASAQPDPELTSAWLDAFSDHSSRSEIFLTLSGRLGREDPGALLSRTEGWTAWEKERVTRNVLANWSYEAPKDAWQWYQANRSRFNQDFTSSILAPWAMADPEAVKGLLNSMEDPDQRKVAIEVVGKVLAEKNTDQAVIWANGLPDSNERESANQAIYEGAPRGIGAVLALDKGFPTVRAIVPGSPLDGSGVQPGDQFLELWEANGTKQMLYGRDLATTVNLIRGEPGSEVKLRLLRENKDSGQLEEHLVPVTRAQLYLNEKAIGKP